MAAATLKPGRPAYTVVKAPGGHYKVFPDGRRVFVSASRPRTVSGTSTGQGVGAIQVNPAAGTARNARPPRPPRAAPAVGAPYFGPLRPDQPQIPATPGSPLAGSGAPSPNPPPTPQGGADQPTFQPDAEYYAGAAQRQFQAGQQRSGLDQQSAYAKVDFDEALRRLLEKQPRDVQSTREAANKAGLLDSGTLGRQEGDINTSYLREQADMRQQYDRAEAAREAARKAIASGLSIDDAAAVAAAVDRQTTRDTARADAGVLAKPSTAAKPAAPKKPKKPAKRQVTQRRTVRTRSYTAVGETGQGFGQITVTPRGRGGGKKASRGRRAVAGRF